MQVRKAQPRFLSLFQQVGHYNYNSDGSPYQLESIDLTAVASEKYWAKHKQKVSYNTFKSPHQIEEFFDFHDESDKEQIDFTYNAFDQRSSRAYDWNPSIERHSKIKYYSGITPIEIKQDLATGENQVLYFIGGDAYSAPVAYEDNYIGNAAEEDRFLYLHRDYLGTIFGITTDAGSGIGGGNDTGIGFTSPELVERRHFDAWGGLVFLQKEGDTEAEFFNEAKYDEEIYLDRGYTGHEHMASVSLIHMNGRLYDAKLRRFLAPDNYVQDPYNTQNFNRYSYVYNNPLIYNDPSGEFIGSVITAIAETFVNIVTRGVNFHNYSYDRTRMAWKIDMGLLKTDSNKSFFSRVRQFVSRFTWEMPQTVIGYSYSHGRNALGKVDDVKYFGGATFVINENAGKRNGVSLGSFININIWNEYNADGLGLFGEEGLYMHEFGHYLQSQVYGISYLNVIGIFSLASSESDNHDYKWYELDANQRAYRYLNKHYNGEFTWFYDVRPLRDDRN